jgi:hypothetical protein
MKHLVLTLWFVLFLSSSALAGVEYVTEEVCHAVAGCWVDTETGECPDCVIERRKVVHTHEEEPVVVEKPVVKKPLVVKTTPKKKNIIPSNKRWVGTLYKCMIGCALVAYWDSGGNNYDKQMNRIID